MKKFLQNLLCFSLLSFYFFKIEKVHSIIPYYYFPTIKTLEKESLSIGKNAYQFLYFGQIKESLNLAKLAVKMNKTDEKLWLILSEAQIANKLYDDALISLGEAEKINPNNNSLGINFKNSKKIENYITNSHYKWADDVVAGPVLGDTLVVYVDNSRVKKIVQLDEQNLIINIEKNTKISLKNIDIQISNLKQ